MPIRSNRPFSITTSTFIASRDLHDNRPLVLNVAAGTAVTLRAATGSGVTYKFFVGTASNANVISATQSAAFVGGYLQNDTGDTAAATVDFMPAVAGNNTYSPTTVNGGGVAGDWFEITDLAVNVYAFRGANGLALDPTNRFSTV